MKDQIPWDAPSFAFVPDRYYVGMAIVPLPPCAVWGRYGGDVTALLWRFKSGEFWVLTYRYRYYAGPHPYNRNDRKTWYATQFELLPEERAKLRFRLAWKAMARRASLISQKPSEASFFWINGAYQKALDLLRNRATRPSWIHI